MPTPVVSLSPLQLVTPQIVGPSFILSVDSSVLPITVSADLNTTRVEISIYNTTTIVTDFTTANGKNVFNASISLIPTVQETTVQIVGRNYNPFGSWTALTPFAAGYTFVDPNGNVQVASVAGTSGILQPTWSLILGGTTSDGSGSTIIPWINLGPLSITPTIKFTLIFFQSNLACPNRPAFGYSSEDESDRLYAAMGDSVVPQQPQHQFPWGSCHALDRPCGHQSAVCSIR